MDQEQERGKGFVDRTNDFISLGRKAFGTGKKLGTISGIFGGGGEAAAAAEAGAAAGEIGAAGATSEVWVPIVVVLVIIIIFTFFLTGATAPGGIGGGGSSNTSPTLSPSSPPGNHPPYDPNSPTEIEFRNLLTGKGRDVNILGDENSFVATVMRNGTVYGLGNKEAQLRQIYRAAISSSVNPLIVLVLWGTEQGFDGDEASAFSCPPRQDTGFNQQLTCAVNTLDNWMRYFEQIPSVQTTGSVVLPSYASGVTCVFSDPILYALERYGPVCTAYDSNDFFHRNFLTFYKQLSG